MNSSSSSSSVDAAHFGADALDRLRRVEAGAGQQPKRSLQAFNGRRCETAPLEPVRLAPNTRISRSLTVLENGSTSCVTTL